MIFRSKIYGTTYQKENQTQQQTVLFLCEEDGARLQRCRVPAGGAVQQRQNCQPPPDRYLSKAPKEGDGGGQAGQTLGVTAF